MPSEIEEGPGFHCSRPSGGDQESVCPLYKDGNSKNDPNNLMKELDARVEMLSQMITNFLGHFKGEQRQGAGLL